MDIMKKIPQILIVDDTPKNIQLVAQILSNHNYKIIVANSGIQALKVTEKIIPDLILLDVMMPEMDGYDTCKKLKESKNTSNIPVIFLTAKSELEDVVKGFEFGGVDYLTKPFQSAELLARVKTQLSLKFTREELEVQKQILEKQNRELMEMSKLRDDIDTINRHDLKNPLQAVISLPDLIPLFGDLKEKQLFYLEMIKSSGLQILTMINDSMDMIKMERGVYELKPVPININQIITKIKIDLLQVINEKKLAIKVLLNESPIRDSDVFYALGEELLCYSMLANIIKNAIEASGNGHTITIYLESNGTMAIIKIHNSEVIPEEIRNNFFDKYSTYGKGAKGTGLGTYSAKLIALAQNGNIFMTTSEQDGTIITIHLPTSQPPK